MLRDYKNCVTFDTIKKIVFEADEVPNNAGLKLVDFLDDEDINIQLVINSRYKENIGYYAGRPHKIRKYMILLCNRETMANNKGVLIETNKKSTFNYYLRGVKCGHLLASWHNTKKN